jgi:phosphohistidine phosphatase
MKMHLYLMQHAEAVPKEVDENRSLTERGRDTAKRMSRYLSQSHDLHLARIYHSGKTRSSQTAQIVSESIRPARGIQEGKELNPGSLPWGWVERLQEVNEDIMVVGHLPHLRRLVALLICQDESKKCVDFQQGGVCHLFRDDSGLWTIQWMLVPSLVF